MNLYKCVVYDKDKKRKTIKVNLEPNQKINEYAKNNKLNLVKVKKIDKNSNEKIKDKELKVICKEMSILLESGCEITKLFNILKNESNKKIGNLIHRIHSNIQMGNSITESFINTNIFSKFFISMIKAGEVSGNLDRVMESLSDYYEKEDKLKSKIINILTYPIILVTLSIGVTLFMLIVIIPNFQIIFENNGINPPVMTKILINTSMFLRNNFTYVIIGILLLISIAFYLKTTSQNFKFQIDKIKFKIPFLRKLTRLIITTRFSRVLYILNSSGVQIINGIEIAANVIDNEFAYERLKISMEYIKRGNTIGESLNLADIFPKLFISMINIGEETGKLDVSLNTINKYYENELDTDIQRFTSMIEPIIIVFLGIIVGGLIISMITPMFDMINSI